MALLFHHPHLSAQSSATEPLTLHSAITFALTHNKTTLFAADKTHANARDRYSISTAAYRPGAEFLSTAQRTDYSPYSQNNSREMTQSARLRRQFLAPLGSTMNTDVFVNTNYFTGFETGFQTLSGLSISWNLPLTLAGIKTGHAAIIRASTDLQQADLTQVHLSLAKKHKIY